MLIDLILKIFFPRLEVMRRRARVYEWRRLNYIQIHPRVGVKVHKDGYIVGYKEKMRYGGYKYIEIGHKRFYVHRLIAEVWCHTFDYSYEVHHKDHNKLNNAASNLMWCTHKENMQFAAEEGRLGSFGARISDETILKVRNSKESDITLSCMYNISLPYLRKIRSGKVRNDIHPPLKQLQ